MSIAILAGSASRINRSSLCSRCLRQWRSSGRMASTTTESSAPLLSKIKGDMKTAMRAKDTARLNVIRAVISEINQAASGSSPVRTDMQVLALLKKRKSASLAAAEEAGKAGRADLKEKQEKEVEILDDYTGSVQMMNTEELKDIVTQTVNDMGDGKSGLKQGAVMKELLKPGGPLDGKPLDRKELSEVVQKALTI